MTKLGILLFIPNLQGWEIVILALVFLVVFGGTKLASAGKNAGRAIREFKEETRALKEDEAKAKNEIADDDVVDAELVDPQAEKKPEQQA